eukprot:TRINITY_DN22544_c0_g1_i1.p1 TRINITY_DN22544_c0_g1~~TRINITY_DN22544_c0_g1_i1.p1  ORF type:complete len:544 (+),score=62.61 TRINITY_DN22544_c0_g1_i1:70-1632(+)
MAARCLRAAVLVCAAGVIAGACTGHRGCGTGSFCTGGGVCAACAADVGCQQGCACAAGSCRCASPAAVDVTLPANFTGATCNLNAHCPGDEYCYVQHCIAAALYSTSAVDRCQGRCVPVPAAAAAAFRHDDDDDLHDIGPKFWLLLTTGVLALGIILALVAVMCMKGAKAKQRAASTEPTKSLHSPSLKSASPAPLRRSRGPAAVIVSPQYSRYSQSQSPARRSRSFPPVSVRPPAQQRPAAVTTNPFDDIWYSPRSPTVSEAAIKVPPSLAGPHSQPMFPRRARSMSPRPRARSLGAVPYAHSTGAPQTQSYNSGSWALAQPVVSIKSPVGARALTAFPSQHGSMVSIKVPSSPGPSPRAMLSKTSATPSPRSSTAGNAPPGRSPYSARPSAGVLKRTHSLPDVAAAGGAWAPRVSERVACLYRGQYAPVTVTAVDAADAEASTYTVQWGDGSTMDRVAAACLHRLHPYLAPVDALFEGDWHPGTVEEFAVDGTYGIVWDDGTATVGVPMADVRERTAG